MATQVVPQPFASGALTQLPEVNFANELKTSLPMIYQQMPNFMGIVTAIANQKQYYYDVIRSLVNAINYTGTNSTSVPSQSLGSYLKIAASAFASTYSETSLDSSIQRSINNRVTFVTSRGTIRDFYQYYVKNNLQSLFTPTLITESGNATLTVSTPLSTGDPAFQQFSYDLFKIKAAGVKIIVNSTAAKQYFELAKADGTVNADASGFSYLDPRNNPVGGGNFKTLTTP